MGYTDPKNYSMSNNNIALVGKQVKDMYGTYIGRVIGTITDIDGTTQSVGIDCGSKGLQQIPFEQVVVQGDFVIFIPKWRLESQRVLREKGLTFRRLKALMNIVSDNDEMKEDAEIIHEKYKSHLSTLEETEKQIKAKLESRLEELSEQMKSIKMLIFDAKVQCKSNEISEQTFESVKTLSTELIEHITHESAEISNVQRRIADLSMEVQQVTELPKEKLQESAVIYLDTQNNEPSTEAELPEAPTNEPISEAPTNEPIPEPVSEPTTNTVNSQPIPESSQPKVETQEKETEESDWLARMEAQ